MTLIGFLVLTGLVILMGTSTTSRYEAEQRAASSGNRAARGAERVGAHAA
ncbi:hypothetical protein [Blastococcus sp. SYSU D00820]